MKNILLKEVICKRCGNIFYVCQSCWRGQAYCSDACRTAAKSKAHRKSQQKYGRTEKGKKVRCLAARRRRLGRSKKTVADTSSTPVCNHVKKNHPGSTTLLPHCLFCGKTGSIVEHFPRRGYGRRHCDTFEEIFAATGGYYGTKTGNYK
jgi:hypothetical protein